MHYWDSLVQEVMAKKENKKARSLAAVTVGPGDDMPDRPILPKRRYVLDEHHQMYLTYREAQCMLLFIHGKTVIKAAHCLALSPRTVEYYLNNMKSKLKCRTKSELIELILQTEFLRHASTLMQELSLDKS
jgi:DNA-binding CsgD family transcriptional regulator